MWYFCPYVNIHSHFAMNISFSIMDVFLIRRGEMINFITGPMVVISFAVFAFGMIYQIYTIRKLAKDSFVQTESVKSDDTVKESLQYRVRMLKHSFIGFHKEKVFASIVFHILIIGLPLFVPAHNILLKQGTGFSFFSFSESFVHYANFLIMVFFSIFIIRRLVIQRVRAISTISDFAILIIVAAPFLTGFVSCMQIMDSKTIYLIHIISGEIMLMALPLTKLIHMIFFFFGPLISIHKETFGNGANILRSEGL